MALGRMIRRMRVYWLRTEKNWSCPCCSHSVSFHLAVIIRPSVTVAITGYGSYSIHSGHGLWRNLLCRNGGSSHQSRTGNWPDELPRSTVVDLFQELAKLEVKEDKPITESTRWSLNYHQNLWSTRLDQPEIKDQSRRNVYRCLGAWIDAKWTLSELLWMQKWMNEWRGTFFILDLTGWSDLTRRTTIISRDLLLALRAIEKWSLIGVRTRDCSSQFNVFEW